MNQNIPPSQPSDSRDASSYQDDRNDGRANPYYSNQQRQAPDLDANAPLLRSNDLQRLNRRALFFLAGIVALLVIAAVWMFSNAGSDEPVVKPREETVVIPELPQTVAAEALPPVEPIEVYTPPQIELPPLPTPSQDNEGGVGSDFGLAEAPRPPSLLERRISQAQAADDPQANNGQDPYLQAMLAGLPGNAAAGATAPASNDMSRAISSATYLNNPDALLVRGTYLRCVLETRIITDIPGFTSCVVTEPVYSINGKRLLLPKGSKISGRYDTDANGPRVAVVWDRITTPNGIDVNMRSPGVDNLGGAGHPGDYNAHWGARISAALMISLISDAFKYAAAEHGPTTTTISNGIVTQSPFESNTADTMERLANMALDRSINRPATVTINQGTVINVYVSKDVDFSGVLSGT